MNTVLINVTNTMPVPSPRGNYITGIGTATIALVNALCRLEQLPYNLKLYATGLKSINFDFYNWILPHYILPTPNRLRIGKRQMDSYVRSKLLKYDLFHITENYFDVAPGERFIVTIHDCTDFDAAYSADLDEATRQKYLRKYYTMAEKSEMIVTISMFSKEEIIKYMNVNPDKVFVNYLGIERERFKVLAPDIVDAVLRKFNINAPYYFACSCNRPRKNLVTALRAFQKLLTYNPQHVFVVAWGNPFPEIKEEFAKEIEDRKIIFLPFLTDEEIVALYNGASLSIYVSRKEGFGMPILESFACGTPVMTCRNSSLPEVGQDAAIYVGEDNIDEMVDVMRMFESASYDIGLFQTKSEAVLNQFSWDNTAKRCIEVYDKCL